jgi:DNA-binding CsgD family transcriptional regulator
MQTYSFSELHPRLDPFRSQIGRLIEVVGTPAFEPELYGLAWDAVKSEHVSAFSIRAGTPPRVLLAANAGSLPTARILAKKYSEDHWKLDPASNLEFFKNGDSSIVAIHSRPHDARDEAFRREFYDSIPIRERLTVMQRRGDEVFRISFCRSVKHSKFDAGDIERVMNSADLLISLLIKHDLIGLPSEGKTLPQLYQDRLRAYAPNMPRREIEVCAAVLLGMTSEAISLMLGISVNTVLTYRKRSYARLSISCQNELFRLILN